MLTYKGVRIKRFFVHALFPELRAAHAQQSVMVEATTIELAAKRGLSTIRKRPHVRGTRFSEVSLRIVVVKERREVSDT